MIHYDDFTGSPLVTYVSLPAKLAARIPAEIRAYFRGPYANWLSVLGAWRRASTNDQRWFMSDNNVEVGITRAQLAVLEKELQNIVVNVVWPQPGPIPLGDIYRAEEAWCVFTVGLVNTHAREIHAAVFAPGGDCVIDTIPFHLVPQWQLQHNPGAAEVRVRPAGRYLVWEAGHGTNVAAADFFNNTLDPPPAGTVLLTAQFPTEDDAAFFKAHGNNHGPS
jgi:hypothetical protein